MHRSESRVLRPFSDSSFLEEVQLSLDLETQPFESAELIDSTRIDEIGDAFAPSLLIPPLPDDLSERVGCSLDELSLVIWASDPSLKIHQASHVMTYADWPSAPITLNREFVERISWTPSCMLGVSLILRASRAEPIFGTASRAGQWVAQKVFKISGEDVGTELPIDYVDDLDFVKRGYPAETTYVIQFDEGGNLNEPLEFGGSFPFNIWFSNKVVSRLMTNPNAPAAKALAAQFNTYAVVEVIRYGVAQLDEEESIVTDSPLDRFIRLTAKHTDLSETDVLERARTGRIEEVRCRLQAKLDVRDALIGSLI